MGTAPAPHTWTAGDSATSTVLQTLTDGILYALGSATSGGSRHGLCRMRQTVAQSLIASATWTAITYDTEDVDYDNGHSTVTSTSRYTAQTAGWHLVGGVLPWTGNATGGRFAALAVNGSGGASLTGVVNSSEVGFATAPNSGNLILTIPTMLVYLNAADYVEMYGLQTSGGGLQPLVSSAIEPMLSVSWQSN